MPRPKKEIKMCRQCGKFEAEVEGFCQGCWFWEAWERRKGPILEKIAAKEAVKNSPIDKPKSK